MKRFLLTLLGVLTILPIFAQDFEYTYEGQTLKYTVLDEEAKTCKTSDADFRGAVSASKINNNNVSGEVTIPSQVTFNGKEYTVVEIGMGSFSGDFTSVTIPNTVTTIQWGAFSYCDGLSKVILPASVTKIGESAFNACSNLRVVYINNPHTEITPNNYNEDGNGYGDVWDPSFSFGRCDKLVAFVCPMEFDDSILNLPYSIRVVHTENTEAVSVLDDNTILDDFGKILISAGIDTESGSYVVPEGVERITSGSINQFLTSITIPASVKYVEADAFYNGCGRVNFTDWTAWYNNVTLENLGANPYRDGTPYAGGVKMTSYELKEGMTEIKDYINYGLEFKDEIELPSTLKRVGAYAFYNNKELYNVFLNDGLEEIGEYAFAGCELLENQKIPETLNKIENNAYEGCASLTEVILPKTLTELGKGVFSGCTKLEKAVIAIDCDTVSDGLFSECSSLYKVYLPNNLKHIGNQSFYRCLSLDEITFPSTLESIGEEAFYYGSLTKLTIPNSVSSIGRAAFSIQKITDLSIGSGLEEIPENAFWSNLLVSVKFSEGLKKIGANAFAFDMDPKGIASVILPSTVTEIGENAFQATPIIEMVIPDGVMSLPAGSCGQSNMLTVGAGIKNIDANAFSLYSLITFRLKATMPPTLSDAFSLTDDQNDRVTLVVNQGRKDRYTTNARWKQFDNIIEEESTDVTVYLDGTYTLAEEIRMQSGLMPSRVNKLKVVGPLTEADLRVMKENMVSLRGLDLSDVTNITKIPDDQFSNSLLTDIAFPKNIKDIGSNAFYNCRLLKLVELPETLSSIGKCAFGNCPGITVSHIGKSVKYVGSYAFMNCTGIREMTVESRTGLTCDPMYNSAAIGVFAGCSLLERVDLSNTEMERVGSGVFADCQDLDEILLPETVKSLGYATFRGTAIRDLSFLPEEIVDLSHEFDFTGQEYNWQEESGTFSNCRRLVSANIPKKVTQVVSNIFENCPRLLSVSIPAGVTSVGSNLVNGDKKLSNISCAAVEAPGAATGTFDNIRLRYVSLTIPTLSFRSYLNAPQWGKFETIMNRLPIPVEIDNGVEVSNVNEDDYQDMLRDDELEAAQDEAAQERDEENAEPLRRRAARRAAARANTKSFAALFDGAQIQPSVGGSGTRIFINPQEGVTVTSIRFNGEEMISRLEGNSLLLPAGKTGSLEIRTNATTTGIESVSTDIDFEAAYNVYDLNGLFVGHDVESLNSGIYIVRQNGAVKKISIR